MHDLSLFSKRLKALRMNANLTQKQLAEESATSERAIQNYESGIRLADTRVLIKFCQYFNISSDYLLGLIDEPKSFREENTSSDQNQ